MKNIFFGLFVALTALALSAFQNTPKKPARATKAGMITANYLVQPFPDTFIQVSSHTFSTSCFITAERLCSYDVTEEGKANIPDQIIYNAYEIDNYLANGWIIGDPIAQGALYHL